MSHDDRGLPISIDELSPGMRAAVKRLSPGTTEVQRVTASEPIGVVLAAAYDGPTQRPCRECKDVPIRDARLTPEQREAQERELRQACEELMRMRAMVLYGTKEKTDV